MFVQSDMNQIALSFLQIILAMTVTSSLKKVLKCLKPKDSLKFPVEEKKQQTCTGLMLSTLSSILGSS